MEDADHRSTAVIAASKNRIGERHEPPYQFERFGRIGFCHLINNGAALRLEIFDQCSPGLPVNEGSGARDGDQPFANLLGDLAGTLCSG